MFQSDYILRVIEQLGVMLQRMLDSLREARPDDVLEASEAALRLALDVDPDTVLALTGDSIVAFMGAGGDPDPAQALIVGETLLRRAQAFALLGDAAASDSETQRARVVLEAAADVGDDEQQLRVRALLSETS